MDSLEDLREVEKRLKYARDRNAVYWAGNKIKLLSGALDTQRDKYASLVSECNGLKEDLKLRDEHIGSLKYDIASKEQEWLTKRGELKAEIARVNERFNLIKANRFWVCAFFSGIAFLLGIAICV